MKLRGHIKPISYLKSNTPDVIRGLVEDRTPVVITLHGEAKAVIQDVDSFDDTQETLALLKILALGSREIEDDAVRPASDVFSDLRARLNSPEA